ncbi:MAG: SPFH/Band 7/PHB domain protein [Desulfovibrionaceae bacterium]|nr:SPFH/Band 7/PHB domain protein [Desulfovibrionaceae bacterium]
MLLVFLFFILVIVIAHVRIVAQSKEFVIERLGAYSDTWGVGLHVLVPLIDRVANIVSLKEQVLDFPPQPVITRDNVTMHIDTVVYFQIRDAKLYTYGVDDPINAIENLTATTLRNVIGEMELDATLTSRDTINSKMKTVLDDATDAWGIQVNRVELKNIVPPQGIQESMEKQMKAERERREAILIAEGKKKSAILVAEGEKEAQILQAEAEKEARIKRAQGEAEAIIAIQNATAQGIQTLQSVGISKEILALKGIEMFEKLGEGESTKIVIPSDMQQFASLSSIWNEIQK